MDVSTSVWLSAKTAVLLAGLLGPGAALMTAFRLPRTIATCFIGSAVSLYLTVLACQLTGIPMRFGTIVAGLVIISGLALTAGARKNRGSVTEVAASSNYAWRDRWAPFTRLGPWTALYVLVWLAVLLRAWRDPLAGPDVEFRWSFLAEQLLRHGSLDFYPPRSAAHFTQYFWVESVPPGVPALHGWAYACAGGSLPAWTVPGVVLQFWALHELIWRAADRLGGLSAARFACLAAAACPLLSWSMLLGQETGLTALALTGIAWALLEWQASRRCAWLVAAGICATLGASAREYGLIFPVLGALGLWRLGANRRGWLAFALAAAPALVWPLRTFVLTGNPFYSLGVGGLFPTNPRFIAWIESDAAALSEVLHTASGWREFGRYLLLFAVPAALGWLWLGLKAGTPSRSLRWLGATVVVVVAIWAASVRYTNGGPFYSLRVLSPALAIGVVAAGVALATLAERRRALGLIVPAVVAFAVVFNLPATLALPMSHWRTPWREWPSFASKPPLPLGEQDETVALVLQDFNRRAPTDRGLVLADAPGYQRRFAPVGIEVVPLWSPQADWLFDRSAPAGEIARRWRASRVTHVVLSKWQTNLAFFNQRSRWSAPPLETRLVGETAATAIFSVRVVE